MLKRAKYGSNSTPFQFKLCWDWSCCCFLKIPFQFLLIWNAIVALVESFTIFMSVDCCKLRTSFLLRTERNKYQLIRNYRKLTWKLYFPFYSLIEQAIHKLEQKKRNSFKLFWDWSCWYITICYSQKIKHFST